MEQRDLEKEAVLLVLACVLPKGWEAQKNLPREAATRNCIRKANSEVWKFSKYLPLYLEASDV